MSWPEGHRGVESRLVRGWGPCSKHYGTGYLFRNTTLTIQVQLGFSLSDLASNFKVSKANTITYPGMILLNPVL